MFHKVECISIICDNCGETFIESHTGFSVFVDKNHANDEADSAGWSVDNENNKHYCQSCNTVDEVDNIVPIQNLLL